MIVKQTDRIMGYMKHHGKITQAEAYQYLGCARLAARIHDLKRDGISISSALHHGKNHYGEPVKYMSYWLTDQSADY